MTVAAGVINGQEIIAPYLFGFILVIIALWITAVYNLNKKFAGLNKQIAKKLSTN